MTIVSRTLWMSAAAICALAAASSAHAGVYQYSETGVGNTNGAKTAELTVDTTAGTGSLIGSGLNISFTGDFSGFTGGAAPSSMYSITIASTSSITDNGHVYTLVDPATVHPDMLKFQGSTINLWATWQSPGYSNLGDTVGTISSSSTGGTAVPEPGMVGLMGLGVLGLAFRRRLANVAGFNAQLA